MIKIAICDDEEIICKKMIIIVQKYFEKINEKSNPPAMLGRIV